MNLEEYNNLRAKPIEEQRYLFHTKFNSTTFVTESQTETYFYTDQWKLIWIKSGIARYKISSAGFCIKGSKLYLRNLKPRAILNSWSTEKKRFYNLDWIPVWAYVCVSNAAFRDIIRKKITNENQLLTHYRNRNIRDKSLSLNVLRKLLKSNSQPVNMAVSSYRYVVNIDVKQFIENTININSLESVPEEVINNLETRNIWNDVIA
jgi:hypothetical protein